MGKGYAEGPAVEAAEEARERLLEGVQPAPPPKRRAVLGCTADDPSPHVLGWEDEVDQDALFASGAAWGLRVVVLDDPAG
jgi:hypothetical protein